MNQEDKLKILKDILLTDEREYASSIHEKIKILEDTINQQPNLSEKVDPIIEEKLNEFIKEIPDTLGPTITEALKNEIKNSQDAVVEALYPILGRMIKKYIQNEFKLLSEKINSQINNTFSFKSFKRKFKAKTYGVSEADLILQDQLKPKLEQFMVIEKGSGLLVSTYSKTNTIEEDMVAGMLTAIKSFVEDAFNEKNQDLELIEYETYSIHIQNFSSYYIAVVISGIFNANDKNVLEDKLLDFAQNIINKTDLSNSKSLTEKLKAYFTNEYL
ncbi:cell envelope biogenesis protein OmpA [Lacinutrix iliipiscaria]|uniref:Cell envelope biogenesis protein OmpA n=1 Tax=Lacinutrix iliipiscaria TaxID=1230532 RepID=A0ABW5WJD0_9FLAO